MEHPPPPLPINQLVQLQTGLSRAASHPRDVPGHPDVAVCPAKSYNVWNKPIYEIWNLKYGWQWWQLQEITSRLQWSQSDPPGQSQWRKERPVHHPGNNQIQDVFFLVGPPLFPYQKVKLLLAPRAASPFKKAFDWSKSFWYRKLG